MRVRTEDHAGNQSFPITLFTFQYDGTPPNDPTTVGSTHHSLGAWSNNRSMEMTWSGTSDAHSGVYGYSYEFSQSLSTIPDEMVDTRGTMAMSSSLSDGNNWYFHIRTRDIAGNLSYWYAVFLTVARCLFLSHKLQTAPLRLSQLRNHFEKGGL